MASIVVAALAASMVANAVLSKDTETKSEDKNKNNNDAEIEQKEEF